MKDAKEKYLSYYEQESKTWPVLYEDIFIETSYGRTFIRKSGSKEFLLWYYLQAVCQHL